MGFIQNKSSDRAFNEAVNQTWGFSSMMSDSRHNSSQLGQSNNSGNSVRSQQSSGTRSFTTQNTHQVNASNSNNNNIGWTPERIQQATNVWTLN